MGEEGEHNVSLHLLYFDGLNNLFLASNMSSVIPARPLSKLGNHGHAWCAFNRQ